MTTSASRSPHSCCGAMTTAFTASRQRCCTLAQEFAAANGWQVTVVEDYGDGHGAVSIGRVQELQQ